MTCKQAIGVANAMKEKYGDNLEVEILTTDSPRALQYKFRSATNVLFNGEIVPVEIAVDSIKMVKYLSENM